nr:vanadium-dependent haloperoxidase [Saprospiraceae bacterium]
MNWNAIPLKLRKTFGVLLFTLLCGALSFQPLQAQEHSLAREWNQLLLNAISQDLARPTVHARNLFHISAGMYDSWAVYQDTSWTYFMGKNTGGFDFPFEGIDSPANPVEAIEETLSFTTFRLMEHRFSNSPGISKITQSIRGLMLQRGYNFLNTSTDYQNGGPAELGNYIASLIIEFGLQDGSHEGDGYDNKYYEPVNPPLVMDDPGNPDLIDPNRWQPLTISNAVDQSGNPVGSTLPFLSPEWGNTIPFSLNETDVTTYMRNGDEYKVYLDPGPPAFLDGSEPGCENSHFKMGFAMVSVWQSHLDPADTVMWDISPARRGNQAILPPSPEDYPEHYNYFEGGDFSSGHEINPITGEPYPSQWVKRGDYARILAEFWADGPDSETPPGHWFSIYNHVRDQELFENYWMGEEEELTSLEYDLRAYLTLGGAMHDAAMAAWSVKGYYDYIRPVSAIRYMGGKGQCSDPDDEGYDPEGLPLMPGFIELVREGDELAGDQNEHLHKVKLFTWRGPDYIDDPEEDVAGVGWILAENWWPYQRPTFVTPPFAGYVSGHSTYSRAAAEVLTLITGTPYFPGGMGEFHAPANEYLEFEKGPSEDIFLQWATYQDASDQSSLSRIWGGIHPLMDDIPGRKIGLEVGYRAVGFANELFSLSLPEIDTLFIDPAIVNRDQIGENIAVVVHFNRRMDTLIAPGIEFLDVDLVQSEIFLEADSHWEDEYIFRQYYALADTAVELSNSSVNITGGTAWNRMEHEQTEREFPLIIDTQNPEITSLESNTDLINIETTVQDQLIIEMLLSEDCKTDLIPTFSFENHPNWQQTYILNDSLSYWLNPTEFRAIFDLVNNGEKYSDISMVVSGVEDLAGNRIDTFVSSPIFDLDTKAPLVVAVNPSQDLINIEIAESELLTLDVLFSEILDTDEIPVISFANHPSWEETFILIDSLSNWLSPAEYRAVYQLVNNEEEYPAIAVEVEGARDQAGNLQQPYSSPTLLDLDTQAPQVLEVNPSKDLINIESTESEYLILDVLFSEICDTDVRPLISLTNHPSWEETFILIDSLSNWLSPAEYRAVYQLVNNEEDHRDIAVEVEGARDQAGNLQQPYSSPTLLDLDTQAP